MYVGLLHLHNLTRWLVLIAAVFAIAVALRGLLGARPWDKLARVSSSVYVGVLDLQMLIGLVLYVISPLIRAGWGDLAAAMAIQQVRFFTVEHALIMIVAVALAHVGSGLARKASTDRARYGRTSLFFSLSLLAILAGIPWWRALFPGL